MADEEVALINEQASQHLSQPEPIADFVPVPTKTVLAEPAAAPQVVEQPAPHPEASVTECEAPKVQVQPDAPIFKPIIASPKLQRMSVSPAVNNGSSKGFTNGSSNGFTNGHTNGLTNGQTNGFSNGQTNGFSNGFTNGFNGLSTPSPAPITDSLQITLNKEEGQTWGFRVGGGKEFRLPLSVNRIQYGGLAERQGIQVQDVVLEINGMCTSEMTHADALDAIKKAGNACLFSLSRSEANKSKMLRPYKQMVPLDDFTVALPSGMRPTLSTPVIAAATMRNVALGTINAEQAETCFTEEVIAETMSSHAEVVIGNALGVNFHKFEPKYDHLALSGVYKMLLEEEQRRGRTMDLPTSIKPQAIARKGPAKAPSPLPPPKEPTPPPKEPTPPPKEPTPPPKEATPPPREPTPPPKEATPPPKEAEPTPVEEPEQQQVEAPAENDAVEQPAPVEPEQNTNGVNGDDPELVAIEQAAQKPPPSPAPAPPAPVEPPQNQYFQQQHQLSKKQKELLEYQVKHKMHLEECRRRINKAQKTIYAQTITPPRIEENSYGMIFELPKAGSRYKPSLPLTPIAFLGNAFPTKEEAFKPFQAKPLPVFKPAGPKPQAKPACAVQCVIPMKWHPPNQLINGQPYKYQPTTHQPNIKDQGEQEFLPPAMPKPPREMIQKPTSFPLQTVVAEPPYRAPSPQPPQLSEDEIAEMMSANAEVIVGQTLGVNFQKYMPGFDHLKNSEVYRLVHGLED